MKQKLLLIVCVLFFFTFRAIAQPKSFSADPTQFIAELNAYFKDAKVNEETKNAFQVFQKNYELVFDAAQQKQLLALANKMAARKMKAEPEYLDWMLTYNDIALSEYKPAFAKTSEILNALIPQKNKNASRFLNFTADFFKGQMLYKSKSVQWFFNSTNFEMVFDSIPKIKTIGKINLMTTSRGDRSVIYQTEGVYYPLSKTWKAATGLVNWTRGGLDSLVVYATLKNYSIDCTKADFTADSVSFFHKQLFKTPLTGRFEDRLSTNNTPENATYPKFTAYERNYDIKDFFKNVDYHGGFSMAGSKLYGIGTDDQKAAISIYVNNKVALKTFSNAFILQKEEIIALPAEVAIYLAEDSIYHPGIEFRFNAKQRQVVLLRKKDGIAAASFFDSYHQMTFEVERMQWDIDKTEIEMGMIKGNFQQESYFESKNFYKLANFRKISGIAEVNPLTILKRIATQQQTNEISIASYAAAVKLREQDVIGLLRSLLVAGYIGLNENRGWIYVKEKTFNYIKNEAGKLDYDGIRFASLSDQSINARLNLLNKDLDIVGVSQIFLSDSQSVNIRPAAGLLKVKANRDMEFSGKVHAGTLDFYGTDFAFNYNRFTIDMPKVDSMKIKVLGKENFNGQRELITLKTVLRDINGVLFIDDMDNKSGLRKYSQYPLFQANSVSYVYYDYPYVQKGVYRRADFYFKINPFMIDSLDDISSTAGLTFPGNFHSGGIFPDFDETLTYQPDTSLGFVTYAPQGGYPLYKGKGNYENQIRLSDKGLYGKGKIDYLASVTFSDQFLFLLDSMNAAIDQFDLKRKATHPLAKSIQSYMHWEPYEDSMFVKSLAFPTDLYVGKNNFNGTICYTPNALNGNGWSNIKGAAIFSRDFVFNPDDFTAAQSIAKINAIDTTKLALEAGNVQSKIDFIAKQGSFKTNEQNGLVKFPANNYATTLPEFVWYFDLQQITFAKGNTPADAYSFISTHPLQDSLNFVVDHALYNLQSVDLKIDGAAKIRVADAEIRPHDAHVEIFGDAIIRRLDSAVIMANVETKYHELFDAKVDIYARRKYNANAYYAYKTKKDTLGQIIHFNEIKVDSGFATLGKGQIADSMQFLLNAKLKYKGDVYLRAANPYLDYDGFVKVNTKSAVIKSQYFRYKGFINPDTVQLAINDPRDENKNKIASGVHIGITNYESYGTFLSKKIEPNDVDVLNVEGSLIYDEQQKLFKIAQANKLYDSVLKGAYYTFDEENETVFAEGPINLGVDFGSKLKIESAGNVSNKVTENLATADLVIALDFEFLKEATQLMHKDIDLNGYEADQDRKDRPAFDKAIAELLPAKESNKFLNALHQGGPYNLPKLFSSGLVISDAQIAWDQTRRSWRSTTDKIGIMSSYDKTINKTFKGYVEIVRKRSGNVLNIYIEVTPDVWYFYTFRQGQMEAISSNTDFNKILTEKTKGDSPFSISAMKRKLDFVRSF